MTGTFGELVRVGARALRRSATWWSVSIVFFVVLNAAFWPSLEGTDMLQGYEEMGDLLEAFGAQDIAAPAGYLDGQLYALMLPLLLSGMAIAMISAVTSGDEDAGRMELLQALPVSRRAVWLSRWMAASGLVVAAAGLAAVAMVVALRPFSLEEVSVGRVLLATAGCGLLAAFHGAVVFAAGAVGLSRGRAVGASVLSLVLGYVMSFLLPLADRLAFARQGSPWFWALGQQPVTDGVDLIRMLLLAGVTAAVVGVGVLAVERRDIRSA